MWLDTLQITDTNFAEKNNQLNAGLSDKIKAIYADQGLSVSNVAVAVTMPTNGQFKTTVSGIYDGSQSQEEVQKTIQKAIDSGKTQLEGYYKDDINQLTVEDFLVTFQDPVTSGTSGKSSTAFVIAIFYGFISIQY